MGMKYIPDGESFSYSPEFGFTGSAKGPNNPLSHPTKGQDEFGDGTYLAQKSAAEPAMARGGRAPHMPASGGTPPKAAQAVLGALQLGAKIGQARAAAGAGVPTAPSAMPAPPAMTTGPMATHLNGMACGGRVGMAEGGLSKGPMHFDGGDHQYDSDASAAEAEAHAQTVPGNQPYPEAKAFAGGGQVGYRADMQQVAKNAPHPTPRPTFGTDTEEFEISANGRGHQVGEMDSKGNVSFDQGRTILAPVDPRGSTNYNKSRVVHMDEIEDPQNRAKGGFIKGAIKHPGRETSRAKASGRSVHEQMEHDKGSKDPSLRGAANLGLRLTGGDLKPKRKG